MAVPNITSNGAGYQVQGTGPLYGTQAEAWAAFQAMQNPTPVAPTTPAASATPVASSDPYRTTLKKLEDSIAKLSDTTAQDKLYKDQEDWLTRQRDAAVAGLEKQYAGMRQETEAAQKNETGSTSARLARIGGYLGGSGSELGVMTNLEQSHRRDIQRLEEAKASAIWQARQAYDAKTFALAQKKLDDARAIEQEIYNRNNDYLNTIKDYDSNLAKDARDAFKFALDNNIKSPYYTLDGVTIWDTATGKAVDSRGIDKSQIQTITPEAEVEFETRTVDGKIVRFGFDSAGNVVSRQELGRSGTTGSGNRLSARDDFGLTKAQRVTADGWVEKVRAEATTLDKVPATYYEYVAAQLEGDEPIVDEEPEVDNSATIAQIADAGTGYKNFAAQYLLAEIEGTGGDEMYNEIVDLISGYGSYRGISKSRISSYLNKAIERLREQYGY